MVQIANRSCILSGRLRCVRHFAIATAAAVLLSDIFVGCARAQDIDPPAD